MKYRVCIISTGRPERVPLMQRLFSHDQDIHWYVKDTDVRSYSMFGAKSVVIAGGLCEGRNCALEDSARAGEACIQLSDDLSKIQWYDGKDKPKDIGLNDAIQRLLVGMEVNKAMLGGVAPTANAFYYTKPAHDRAFIVGDFIAVRPEAFLKGVRFDTGLKLKEDYDYTLQHLQAFGKVYRENRILATFAHRTNSGGAVEYRTREREQEAIAYLKAKWGSLIKENPRRPDEILLNLGRV